MSKSFLSKLLNTVSFSGKAGSGIIYVVVIMATLIAFSFVMMGGEFPDSPAATTKAPNNLGKQEIVFTQDPDPGKKTQQLQTFKVKNSCESRVAVNFVIDVSGSMRFGDKQAKEKEALRAFTSRMVDDSVIGIQIFSAGAREVVPISKYKDVRSQVQATINGLVANGNTETRKAMQLAKDKLSAAISQNKFPDYKYSLILLTDGVPETANLNEQECVKVAEREDGYRRCFAIAEDPRVPTNLGTEIKNLGVKIYSINITSLEKSDVEMGPYLEALLQNLASEPDSDHYYKSLDGKDLTPILNRIFTDICSE